MKGCLKSLGALGLVALLGACASQPQENAKATSEKEASKPIAQRPAFEEAACTENRARGLTLATDLLNRFPDDPSLQLIHAYAIERVGRPGRAWRMLRALSNGGHRKNISLSCQGNLVFQGPVSQVAEFRAQWLARNLARQGVMLTDEPRRNSEDDQPRQIVKLPPPPFVTPEAPRTVDQASPEPAPKPVQKLTKTGGYFAHLASYKGQRLLDRGWRQIKSRFGNQLAAYEKTIKKVEIGGNKGSILRLGVLVHDRKAGRDLCQSLKSQRQYCMLLK